MSDERFFCAANSRAKQESMCGTVARVRSWLLLEYPGTWWRDAVQDSRLLPASAKHHIGRLTRLGAIDRSLLIRRGHAFDFPVHCFFVRSCGIAPQVMGALLPDYDALQNVKPSRPLDEILYAVCTHGRHDKCCAKFGLPVYRAFREEVGKRVWECSHVGGDRFAANVVVFPYGIYYGQVCPDDVAEIVRRTEAGEVWMPGYRGRSCFRRAEQVAEYFARAQSGRLGIDEFRPVATTLLSEDSTRVQLEARSDGSIHVVDFRTRMDTLDERLTCGSMTPSPIPQHELLRYLAFSHSSSAIW